MEINTKIIPREFKVGFDGQITLKDCGQIHLSPNEQVTFITPDKKEYDICRKEWGFYATPSVNGRLTRFGFKTALVENQAGMRFVWLIENDKKCLFEEYLIKENNKIIQWLSNSADEKTCICGGGDFKLANHYTVRPDGEMTYDLKGMDYKRDFLKCQYCGHFLAKHDYDIEKIYQGQYSEATYQDKMVETFNKIISLPIEKSDNHARVKHVIEYCRRYFGDQSLSVMDVGSGLCVFLYLLSQKTNWSLLALDPDARQAHHAKTVCNVNSVNADFGSFQSTEKFDLITFNKVLEHVADPVAMLSLAKQHLAPKGIIYIELPDGTEAFKDSPLREEFFIEHYHAFSMASISILTDKANLSLLHSERLKEPSGKYTLRAFCLSSKGD